MTEADLKIAIAHLQKDKILSEIIITNEQPIFSREINVYLDILDSIVSQQLSVKAAATIFKRFLAVFSTPIPIPEEILAKSEAELRAVGLSYQKIKYVKSLAQAVKDKTLIIENLAKLSDEAVIAELTKIKGIGRWTAEMILIFSLARQDVFSLGDLGLRNAVARAYGVDRDDLKAIEKISQQWSPHRSLASRYLWKSLNNLPKNEK
jgi:DNA-3-methyladenine glycosylase II